MKSENLEMKIKVLLILLFVLIGTASAQTTAFNYQGNLSEVLGNNASVGIGTTAPKAKLDVAGGNVLTGSAGHGIILKSPDGLTCKLFSIDNAGAKVLTTVACP